ncbi:hypothetical protein NQ176_g4624 [Zarea fungicola]|uniref:Uncharacterized protein n=1 Tax=Zarea fungicola TaxID=93591 RepID=A0ACC1NDE2_9HYPO|nr:hypothetical protein NQ176_g4624 [Lecanicillium fungicola]
MSDSKHEVSTTENVREPGKKGALKRHCQRFWWLHLIIFIVIAVFIILITIFVAIPRIAQDKINQAKLEIVSVKITNAAPNSFTMDISSTISTDGTVKANIQPFKGAMYLPDAPNKSPFTILDFPPTNANKHSWVNFTQDITVGDIDAFEQFNTWFVNNKTLNIGIKGDTRVQPAGLDKTYPVTFQKTLPTSGLNLFDGMQVIDPMVKLQVDNGSDPNFRNFWATAVLPNPSHFSLDIGNAVFDNYYYGQNLGKLYIDNLSLVPGDNRVNVTGSLDQGNILVVAAGHKPDCETGIATFTLVGSNVTRNGQEIPYFNYALAHANQTVHLNLTDTLTRSGLPVQIQCSKTAV